MYGAKLLLINCYSVRVWQCGKWVPLRISFPFLSETLRSLDFNLRSWNRQQLLPILSQAYRQTNAPTQSCVGLLLTPDEFLKESRAAGGTREIEPTTNQSIPKPLPNRWGSRRTLKSSNVPSWECRSVSKSVREQSKRANLLHDSDFYWMRGAPKERGERMLVSMYWGLSPDIYYSQCLCRS